MNEVYDIVVIGGGPCGLAAIVEAKTHGVEKVLLLEKGDNHSQTIRQFYKDNKRVDKEYKGMESETIGSVEFEAGTKESVLNYFDTLLDNDAVDTSFKSEVEKVEKNGDIFIISTSNGEFKAKSVVVAIGKMGKPNKPDYKIPPSITQRVNFNLDKCTANEKVLVVGGGNSAAEYALSIDKTNRVTLCYRKDKFTRLNDINESTLMREVRYGDIILRMGVDITALENLSMIALFTLSAELLRLIFLKNAVSS